MSDLLVETPVVDRTVAAALERQVRERPDHVAVIEDGGRTLTYAELQVEAFRVAAGLRALGVGRQEPVAVMLDNHVDCALVSVGTMVSDAILAPINTAFKGDILRHVLANSGCSVVVVEAPYLERIAAVGDELPDLQVVVVRGEIDPDVGPFGARVVELAALLAGPPTRPEQPGQVWDTAALLYTSGTTGASKGVCCPHGHLYTMATTLPTSPDDVVLVTLPLFHGGGLVAQFYGAIRSGATAVFIPGFSGSGFLRDVRRFGVTVTILFGAMIPFVSNQPEQPDDADNPLKLVVFIPAPPALEVFAERFGVECISFYGLTEAGTVFVTDPGDARPSVIGRPRPHIQVRLVDNNDVEVALGEVGEITLRSAEPWSTMNGYYNMPDSTVSAWRNLWLHTGDTARQDETGNYVFVDRTKDALRRRGENVSSLEVEGVIVGREDVSQVAIVAVPSEFGEDDIKAVIVLNEGFSADPEGIMRDLVDRLPYFMVPRYYEFVTSLPLTMTHKVLKAELRRVGVNKATWDCEAAGLRVTRHGIQELQRQ